MTLFYPVGVIMDKYGRKYAVVPSFLVLTVGMTLLPFTTDFLSLLMASTMIRFGNGLGSGTMMTLGADLAPLVVQGEFLGVWGLIGDSGSIAEPLFAGKIADLFILSTATLVIACTGLLAALIFLILVPETLEIRPVIARQP